MSGRRVPRGGDPADDEAGDEALTGAAAPAGATRPAPSSAPGRGDTPVLPTGAREDSARAWGDDERDDDERLLRERPPHW